MTPKEKAEELLHRYDVLQTYIEGFNLENAKQCALIAVDEIIEEVYNSESPMARYAYWHEVTPRYAYWKEVKQHIEQL
jgi:hypothetical protein